MMYKRKFLFTLFLMSITVLPSALASSRSGKPPRLAIIFVIDQLGYRPFEKIKKHFNDGLHFLLTQGMYYTNFHHPHAKPATATGHAALSTGTWPKYHGYIDNDWVNSHGEKVASDDDSDPNAAQLAPKGVYLFGKSPHRLMVDTLADQIMLSSDQGNIHEVISLSHKSRSSIALAGRAGKAFWFDETKGQFTSSKAYMEKLPMWVQKFNQRCKNMLSTQWQLRFPPQSAAYSFDFIKNYDYSSPKKGIIGKLVNLKTQEIGVEWSDYLETPAANQLLLDLAQSYLEQAPFSPDHTLNVLYLSLSCTDLVGHTYGPDSLEYIDMIYHLDKQLGDFFRSLFKKFKKSEVLIALTADHGTTTMPEFSYKKGFTKARRINSVRLIDQMNKRLQGKFNIAGLVKQYIAPSFYLDEAKLSSLDEKKRSQVLWDLQQFLKAQPGFNNVWRYHELATMPVSENDFTTLYKNQLYQGRSGHLICHLDPYTELGAWQTGVSHATPFAYNTHVPLLLYQKNRIAKRNVCQQTWSPQLAVTLAYLLNVPKPSASCFALLPEIK